MTKSASGRPGSERERMLTKQQIGQMVRAGSHGQLVRRVLANGRCTDQAAIQMLMQQDVVEIAALGLALQRWCELTGCGMPLVPDPAARMTHRLRGLVAQRLCGRLSEIPAGLATNPLNVRGQEPEQLSSNGSALPRDLPAADAHLTSAELASLACAARGLLDRARSCSAAERPIAADLAEQLVDLLASEQSPDGSIGSPLASAIILWQLGGEASFRDRVRFDDLCLALRRLRVRSRARRADELRPPGSLVGCNQPPLTGDRRRVGNGAGDPPRQHGRNRHECRAVSSGAAVDEGLCRQALAWSA